MTLSTMALGPMTLAKQVALVLGGTALIAVAAQVSVPFYPVPVTLQTLAILFVGFALGSRLAAVTVLAYLAEGAMGLPVFTGFKNGVAFAGPTAGFLIGFVGMAWLAGLATDRGIRNPTLLALVAVGATLALYLPGLAWPLLVAQVAGIEAGWAGVSLTGTVGAFMTPFLLGDVVKAVLAALLAWGGMRALRARA
jgi:biotin transport system substrate-specific component